MIVNIFFLNFGKSHHKRKRKEKKMIVVSRSETRKVPFPTLAEVHIRPAFYMPKWVLKPIVDKALGNANVRISEHHCLRDVHFPVMTYNFKAQNDWSIPAKPYYATPSYDQHAANHRGCALNIVMDELRKVVPEWMIRIE